MKIALVTYHQVYNYGSSLQAYATKRTLEKLGCAVDILNYVPTRFSNYGSVVQTYREKAYFSHNPIKCLLVTLVCIPSRKKQKKVFNKFDRYLNLGEELTEKDMYHLSDTFDAYFTGSDQVWNNYYGGFDKIFFLDFVKNAPCFAYSASFGKEQFDKQEYEWLSRNLQKYELISVREKSGTDVLRTMGINSVQLLDPVYTLSKDEWAEITDERVILEDYILIYQLNSRNCLLEKAIKLQQEKKVKKIVVIEYERRKRDSRATYISLPTVNMFLSLFRYAKYVVTDSFHGTSFSIKFNREFAVALPPNFKGRIQSILEILELENRVISIENPIESIVQKSIDWNNVNRQLTAETKKNVQFLKNCIEIIKANSEG